MCLYIFQWVSGCLDRKPPASTPPSWEPVCDREQFSEKGEVSLSWRTLAWTDREDRTSTRPWEVDIIL